MDNREAELPNKTDDNLNNFQKLSNNLIAGRQAKSMSLDDVVSATRISRYFIDALESGSFDRLPEEVFIRGFVRNLVKLYEIESSDTLALLDLVLKSESTKLEVNAQESRSRPNSMKITKRGNKPFFKNNRFKSLPTALLLLGALTGLVSGLVYFYNSPEDTDQASDAVVDEVLHGKSEESSNDEEVVFIAKKETDSQSSDLSATKGETVSGEILDLKVTTNVRLKISKDGGAWFTETLKPDVYQYRFQKELSLVVFDAGAVEVSYNGDQLGPLGKKGFKKRVAFKSSGLKKQ